MDWGKRLREEKWQIISCVLGIALSVGLFYSKTEPKPPPRLWPPGDMPQNVTFDRPPEGRHTCRTEGAPAPVELGGCMAGPDKGLKTCDSRVVHHKGQPSFCLVSRCPPLPAHARQYYVTLICTLQRDGLC